MELVVCESRGPRVRVEMKALQDPGNPISAVAAWCSHPVGS